MATKYDQLPPQLIPRGLTRETAAAFVGLSLTGFDRARAKGQYPGPTLPGKRYDRVLLDLAANKASGIMSEVEAKSPLDEWRRGNGAR